MLAPRAFAPRVTRCSLGKYWSRDFFSERGWLDVAWNPGMRNWFCSNFSLTDWLGIQDVILSRSDRLPMRWGQQAASLGSTGYV